MRRDAALVLAVLCSACSPVVLHPARVTRGLSLGATIGSTKFPCDTDCNEIAPPLGLVATYGSATSDSSGAILIGVEIPAGIVIPAAQLDAYAQLPAAPDALTFGVGGSVSRIARMAYVEVGKKGFGGSWFIAHGITQSTVVIRQYATSKTRTNDYMNGYYGTVYWVPEVGIDFERGHQFTAYLAGSFGRIAVIESAGSQNYRRIGYEHLSMLMAGIVVRSGGH